MFRIRILAMTIILSLLAVIGVSATANANTSVPVPPASTTATAPIVIPLDAYKLTVNSKPIPVGNNSHKIVVEIRDEMGRLVSTVPPSGEVSPNIAVGLGWSIYVYLNAGNINWLRGLGYTAASAALCAILVVTIVGGIACAVAAYIVYTIFYQPTVIPSGYCMEYRFNYGGGYQGSKLVRRTC